LTQSSTASLLGRLPNSSLLESEDARMTGGTRSLSRRLMGLNVADVSRKKVGSSLTPVIHRRVA
jgi:hypothetical protein